MSHRCDTKPFMIQLLGWMGGHIVLCVQPNLSSNFVDRCGASPTIIVPCHLIHSMCQGTSETGNVSCPSAHRTLMDLWNRCSRGWVPAECLEQKMLYVYATVCTQGDFTLSRK